MVAGNWKMNTVYQSGIDLAKELNQKLEKIPQNVQVIIAPPFTHLSGIRDVIAENKITLAAQNCATHEKGAYTGEVSASMLKSIGVKMVILGHSERRSYYNEDSQMLREKVNQVLGNNQKVIFCFGEVLQEREENRHFEVVKNQLNEVVLQLCETDFKSIILAYEPVWAIGTGKTASPEQAQEMHAFIRGLIKETFSNEMAENTTILYGGSCNAQNAAELFSKKDVDGGLIGGASLKADDFITIINSFPIQ